jgi:UDP-N-acetylglucosamine:LPS N-acetylglucosamine transferase
MLPERRPKILLAIGDVGSGHRSPANALAQALQERFADAFDVVIEDFFGIVDPSPLGDSNRAQRLFARQKLLKMLVNDPVWHLGNTDLGHRLTERYLLRRTLRAYRARLEQHAPALVVSLHPYLNLTLGAIKRRGGRFRYAVVVVDLASLLRGWADPAAELIVSPTEEASLALRGYGVEASRIVAPLFPLTKALRSVAPRIATIGDLGLDPAVTTVLLSGGGGGGRALMTPLAQLARDGERQLIVACGKDEALTNELRARYRGADNIRVLGFVTNLPDFFAAADVVIAKPGPSTILELEALGKKTILTGDLGPQEVGNVRYAVSRPLVRHIGSDWRRLAGTVDELLAQPAAPWSARHRLDEATIIAEHLVARLRNGRG